MWFEGYFAFESLLNSAHFIRRCDEQLILQKYENTQVFKEDASFKLTRKRCIGGCWNNANYAYYVNYTNYVDYSAMKFHHPNKLTLSQDKAFQNKLTLRLDSVE